MVLLDAIYFKGFWEDAFDPNLTKSLPFYNEGTQRVRVKTLTREGDLNFGSLRGLKSRAVQLPYVGGRYSMVIVLPDDRTGLQKLTQSISAEQLGALVKNLSPRDVRIQLPKFELNTEYNLVPTLKKLGLRSIFDAAAADLSGISGQGNLTVTKVQHKAAVEVNEEGTVAAAITVVVVETKSGSFSQDFNVKHPFLFYIWDNLTNRVLFVGEVYKL